MNLYQMDLPNDIKSLSIVELNELAATIRKFLIESLSTTGGHLSSNLGIIELTIALHYVFDSPNDKLIFDVGHQSYVHKILTNRIQEFSNLRMYKGISGFQKRKESVHDSWEAGHSSTSLSAALGMAVARDLKKENYHIIPIIGDGALGGGMALEALNQIGSLQNNMIIILNDNTMSISKNVGAMDKSFTKLRTSQYYTGLKYDIKENLSRNNIGKSLLSKMRSIKNHIKDNIIDTSIFGEFNIDYLGPVDGHNIADLIRVLKIAKMHQGPIVIHAITKKGKGYSYAENDIDGEWHGVSPFDIDTGKSLTMLPANQQSWSAIISNALLELALKDERIVAITPAMKSGSKLTKFFNTLPQRSFDCGIAEEHAMCFAAGLANNGLRPFISVYSSFLQRCYDQVNHDVARMDLPVVIGIDRAGLVGEDGETHHGVFDIAFLRHIPNLIIAQPKDALEARNMLYTAFKQEHPFAIRYPRGSKVIVNNEFKLLEIGSWEKVEYGKSKIAIITYGDVYDLVCSKARSNQYEICVVNARFFKPLDYEMIEYLCTYYEDIIVYENDCLISGLGSAILEYINDHHLNHEIKRIGIHDHYVTHGSISQLKKIEHIDLGTLFSLVESLLAKG